MGSFYITSLRHPTVRHESGLCASVAQCMIDYASCIAAICERETVEAEADRVVVVRLAVASAA